MILTNQKALFIRNAVFFKIMKFTFLCHLRHVVLLDLKGQISELPKYFQTHEILV